MQITTFSFAAKYRQMKYRNPLEVKADEWLIDFRGGDDLHALENLHILALPLPELLHTAVHKERWWIRGMEEILR